MIILYQKTMDTLTKMLAKKVYGLDLSNLPLDKLEEKRKKRLLGSKTEKREQKPHPRSFSTGWGRSDSTSPQGENKSTFSPCDDLLSFYHYT